MESPEARITGGFPGGPTVRPGHALVVPAGGGVRQLVGTEAREAGLAGQARRRHEELRLRLRLGVWAGALLVAFASGAWVGRRHSTPATAEVNSEGVGSDAVLSREVNRALLELWRMEDAELRRAHP